MPMSQAEIDDISDSFQDAWSEYFGMDVYYRKRGVVQPTCNLYDENSNPSSTPRYTGPIKATKIENPTELQLKEFGLSKSASAIFTCISKELIDEGITVISNKDIIKTAENGVTLYEIVDYSKATQFLDTFIFTSLGVTDYAE